MTSLYNCRHDGDQYRVTKFDEDMNVESSYLTDGVECDCPAGVRPTCRHRQMLPKFLAREHVGDEWMFDYDRGGWVQMGESFGIEGDSAPTNVFEVVESVPTEAITPDESVSDLPPLPEGVTMVVLDSPEAVVDVHNAIAEAVGEPPAKRWIKRRL
jgi:hypothetical protein